MSDIVFIHGFCTHLECAFRAVQIGKDHWPAGFKVAEKVKKKISIFQWAIPYKFNILQSINPFSYLQIYIGEGMKILNPKTEKSLELFLEKEKPTKIVCFSMGCQFLLDYAERYNLPKTVKEIVFMEADIPFNHEMPKKIQKIKIANYYCPHDDMLFLATIINVKPRAGNIGWKQPNVENKIHFLKLASPIHNYALWNKKIAEEIVSK